MDKQSANYYKPYKKKKRYTTKKNVKIMLKLTLN